MDVAVCKARQQVRFGRACGAEVAAGYRAEVRHDESQLYSFVAENSLFSPGLRHGWTLPMNCGGAKSNVFSAQREMFMRRFVLSLARLCVATFALLVPVTALAAPATPTADRAVVSLDEIPAFDAEASPEGPLPSVIADAIEHAKASLDSGNSQDAIHALNNALAVSSVTPSEALYYLALARSDTGRHVDARVTAEYAVNKSPHDPRINFLLGRLYYQEGHADKAILHLRRATLADESNDPPPEWTAAWAWLGEVLAEEGYLRAAAAAYGAFDEAIMVEHREHRENPAVAAVLKRYPNGLLDRRIELLRRANLPEELVAATRDTLALRPDDLDVMRAHLRALLDAGDAQQAWEVCEQLLSRNKVPVGLLQISAEAAVVTDQLATWIERRLNNDAVDLATKRRIAEIVTELEDYEAGARVYAAVFDADRTDLGSAWSGAVCYLKAGNVAEADGLLYRALDSNAEATGLPGAAFDAWVRLLANDAELLGQVDQHLQRSSNAKRSSLDALQAVVDELQGKAEEASDLVTKAVAAEPKCLALQLLLPRTALAQYRWQDALVMIAPVIEAQPELAGAYAIRGIAADGMDQNSLAELSLERAIELAPKNTEYLLALAHVEERQRAWVSAQLYAQKALEIEPHNGDALELAVKTYLADGKLEIANQVVSSADPALLPAEALRRARLAIDIAQRGFGEETRARLATLFERYPNDAWIGRHLVRSLYVLDRLDEAYALIQDLHERFPDDEDVWFLLIEVAASKLEYATAIPMLEASVQRYPQRRILLARLSLFYGADFQVENERQILNKLIELTPGSDVNLAYRSQLVDTFVRFGDWDGALAELDRWPESPKLTAQAFELRMKVLRYSGQYDACIAMGEAKLKELGQDAPDISQYRRWLLDALHDAKRYQRELELLDEYRDDEPQSLEWFQFSLFAYLELKQYDDAWALFNDYQPEDEYLMQQFEIMQALVLSKRGDVERALVVLEQSLNRRSRRADLDRTDVQVQIINTLSEADRNEEAIQRCLAWLEQMPAGSRYERSKLLQSLAFVYQRDGQMDAYAQTLSELHSLLPNTPGVLNDLGYTWVDAGQNVAEATRMIEKAVSLMPFNNAYLDSLGWAAYKQGDYAKAVKWLDRATRLFDTAHQRMTDPIMFDHLGDALWRNGDPAAAQAAWKKALARLEADQAAVKDEAADEDFSADSEKLVAALRAKLDAAKAGETPGVADIVTEAAE